MRTRLFHIPIFIVLSILVILPSCKKEELVLKNNLLYERGSDVPFTGREKDTINNKVIEYDVKDGYKHGEYILYFENGNKEIQGQLDSNRNVGKWIYYFRDGKIESEGNFYSDQPDGKWIWNYPNGKRKEEGEYRNGVRIGNWIQYDDSGNVTLEHNYSLSDTLNDDSNIQESQK